MTEAFIPSPEREDVARVELAEQLVREAAAKTSFWNALTMIAAGVGLVGLGSAVPVIAMIWSTAF
ncbi:hypothetical protein D3C76_1351960 [compost metagenome]